MRIQLIQQFFGYYDPAEEVPVRSSRGTPSRTGQEHRPTALDVRAVELVDGPQTNLPGVVGLSASLARAKARKHRTETQGAGNGQEIQRWFRV